MAAYNVCMSTWNNNNSNNNQTKEEDKKPVLNLQKAESFLSMTFESSASDDLLYTVSGNRVTILASKLNESMLQNLFKKNYSLLLSILQNSELEIEVDIGEFVFPLTIKTLKDISKFYL